jgi:hypothetical protein
LRHQTKGFQTRHALIIVAPTWLLPMQTTYRQNMCTYISYPAASHDALHFHSFSNRKAAFLWSACRRRSQQSTILASRGSCPSTNSSSAISPSSSELTYDTFGLERLPQYILRCPFSQTRIIRLTEDGSVVYRVEKDPCHRFPGAASRDLRGGPSRNFQLFSAMDFQAELTQPIPEKNGHIVRIYGWYSHRRRGMRTKLDKVEQPVKQEDEQVSIHRSALNAEKSASDGPLNKPWRQTSSGLSAVRCFHWSSVSTVAARHASPDISSVSSRGPVSNRGKG